MSDQEPKSLTEALAVTARAHDEIIPGKTKWGGSPFAWIVTNGPGTKSKIARTIIEDWGQSINWPFEWLPKGGTFDPHCTDKAGGRIRVAIGTKGKDLKLQWSSLLSTDDVDRMLLIGVEPFKLRIWSLAPQDCLDLPAYGADVAGMHTLSIDPEDPPAFLKLVAHWQ